VSGPTTLDALYLTNIEEDAKTAKFNGRTNAGEFWVINVIKYFKKLGKDKELRGVFDQEEEASEARSKAWAVMKALDEVRGHLLLSKKIALTRP
jgi:hypothetical protein